MVQKNNSQTLVLCDSKEDEYSLFINCRKQIMKMILRKKFVLMKSFQGPGVSSSIQIVGFAAFDREMLSAWRDRKEATMESLETSQVHQASIWACGTRLKDLAQLVVLKEVILCSPDIFQISQDTMITLISRLSVFEGSNLIRQPIV